jgi:hypothetical protein
MILGICILVPIVVVPLAMYFLKRGYPSDRPPISPLPVPSVRVGEDLTEFFFARMRTRGIPLVRAKSESGLAKLEGWERDFARQKRREHPWLEQVPEP